MVESIPFEATGVSTDSGSADRRPPTAAPAHVSRLAAERRLAEPGICSAVSTAARWRSPRSGEGARIPARDAVSRKNAMIATRASSDRASLPENAIRWPSSPPRSPPASIEGPRTSKVSTAFSSTEGISSNPAYPRLVRLSRATLPSGPSSSFSPTPAEPLTESRAASSEAFGAPATSPRRPVSPAESAAKSAYRSRKGLGTLRRVTSGRRLPTVTGESSTRA